MDSATKAIMEEAAEKKKAKQAEAAYSKARTSIEYNPKMEDDVDPGFTRKAPKDMKGDPGFMRSEDDVKAKIDNSMMAKPRRTKDGKDTGEMGKPWHQMFN